MKSAAFWRLRRVGDERLVLLPQFPPPSQTRSPGQSGRGGFLSGTFFLELQRKFAGFGRGDFHAMTGFEAGVFQP
jgi:hypothetical protein